MTDTAKLYAVRNIDSDALAGLYGAHVSAMTIEGLTGKAAIAAELAWRDAEIEKLRKRNKRLINALREITSVSTQQAEWFFAATALRCENAIEEARHDAP